MHLEITETRDLHIRKSFRIYDLGLAAVLGNNVISVWEHMFRFVMRRKVKDWGQDCIAKVGQKKLATLTGLRPETVSRMIKTLSEYGFVEIQGERNFTRYKLGTWHAGVHGRVEEIFGVSIVNQVYDAVEEWGQENNYKKVTDIPVEARVAKTRELMENIREGLAKNHQKAIDVRSEGVLTSHQEGYDLTSEGPDSDDLTSSLEVHNRERKEVKIKSIKEFRNPGSLATPDTFSPEHSEGEQVYQRSSREIHLEGKPEEKNSARPTHRVTPNADRLATIATILNKQKADTAKVSDASVKKTRNREARVMNTKATGNVSAATKLLRQVWEKHFKANFPDTPLGAWSGKQYGILKQLIDAYDGDAQKIRALFEYALNEWPKITENLKKAPSVPTVGFLRAMHDSLVPEAVRYQKVAKVYQDMKDWKRRNPNEAYAPAEIQKPFDELREEMIKLGLLR